jgi:hypothetical protein
MTARPGAVLLEVMVALAILGAAAVASLAIQTSTSAAIRTAASADSIQSLADELMGAVSLWSVEDLDRRLGERIQGAFVLELHRVVPQLYDVTIRERGSGVALLSTTLFRPGDLQ